MIKQIVIVYNKFKKIFVIQNLKPNNMTLNIKKCKYYKI